MAEKRHIIVTDYKEEWKNEFKILKDFFNQLLDTLLVRIEHVGSTSIEGLAAKPIIDMILVIEMEDFEQVKEKLESVGYSHEGDLGITGREAFKRTENYKLDFHKHNLYVCDVDADELKRYHIFLNYLRNNGEIKKQYGEIKKEAAKLYPHDIIQYMDHKGGFIAKHLTKAMELENYIPPNDISICEKCKKVNLMKRIQIDYIGEGGKQEILEIICRDCSHQWTTVIQT